MRAVIGDMRALWWSLPVTLVIAAGCSASTEDPCSSVSGTACTWAGVKEKRGFNQDGLHRQDSWLGFVADLTFAPDGRAWLLDWNNHRIRRVETDDTLVTMVGTDYEGDGSEGETDRLPAGAPEGAPGTEVAMNHPTDLEFMPDGTVVIAAWHNNKVRTYDPETGIVKVLAGNGYGYEGENVPAYQAIFNQPKAIAIDPSGQIYVVDQRNQRLRLIANDADRTIRTIAGDGTYGYAGDGDDAATAQFAWDQGITPVPNGALALRGTELFIADSRNHRIRKLDLVTNQMSCVAGNGNAGSAGNGGPAMLAELNEPLDIEFGPDGRLYVADSGSNSVRAINLETGTIDRVAGTGEPCETLLNCYEAEEGLDALSVRFASPYGIAFDQEGHLYVADTNNSRIVRITR